MASSYLLHGRATVVNLDLGLTLMAFALVTNGALGLSLWYRGRLNKALTLEAEGVHLIVDALDSAVVLAAIAIIRITGWQWVDPAAALAVAAYIAYTGVKLRSNASAAGLMDQQDPEDRRRLQQILDFHIGPTGKDPHIWQLSQAPPPPQRPLPLGRLPHHGPRLVEHRPGPPRRQRHRARNRARPRRSQRHRPRRTLRG